MDPLIKSQLLARPVGQVGRCAEATADEFESAVNALQAELDEMRMQRRRLLGT